MRDESAASTKPDGDPATEIERLRGLLVAERRRFHMERVALQAKCLGLRDELARAIALQSSFRFQVVERAHRRLKRHPWLFAFICFILSTIISTVLVSRWLLLASIQYARAAVRATRQRVMHALRHVRNIVRVLGRGLFELAFLDSTMWWVRRTHGWGGVLAYVGLRLRELMHGPATEDLDQWLIKQRPSRRMLRRFQRRRWPEAAPQLAVVVRIPAADSEHLRATLQSLATQVYTRWNLIVIATHDIPLPVKDVLAMQPDLPGRIEFLSRTTLMAGLAEAVRICEADHLFVLDQGDTLEPHALYRFADAIVRDNGDVLYCDSVHVDRETGEPICLQARPDFGHMHLLSQHYLTHAVVYPLFTLQAATATELPDDDYDLLLRVLEHAERVTHVPEALVRHRMNVSERPGDGWAGMRAVEGHLRRLGLDAEVRATDHPSCRDVQFTYSEDARVAIIIPTKNRAELLRQCLASLERTLPPGLADVCIVDHESDEPETKRLLAELGMRHRVLRHEGPFNFSAINNHAVAELDAGYSHYLFLNNDTEAISPGWLEHMLGHASRDEVGIVGAMLLYPDRTVQHAGVIVGLHYGADHGHKHLAAYGPTGRRRMGPDSAFLATREQSAVTGACLLFRADVFRSLGGFDEEMAVGFGDTDLCLRARERGLQVVLDVHATLIHHESATRGVGACDPHPEDTKRFRARHLQAILKGDPFYSLLLSRQYPYLLSADVRPVWQLPLRTVAVAFIPGKAAKSELQRVAA
jgi:GT2 family glycosyltransferase